MNSKKYKNFEPCVVPDLVAGVAEADGSVAVVARALAGEAKRHRGLEKQKQLTFVNKYI